MKNEFTYYCHQISNYTQDISLIILKPVDEHLIYTAGQYVEVILSSGEILPLSIANKPCADGHLEFHIRHDKNHFLAQQFIRKISQEKTIHLLGPKGQSTLTRADNAKKILLVAGGTGFAPINALLEEAISQFTFEIYLYWGVKRPEDAYKASLLKDYQADNTKFHYTIVLSEPELYPKWQKPTGLVHEFAANQHTLFHDLCVFASGPYPMINQAKILFLTQGLHENNFISDLQTY